MRAALLPVTSEETTATMSASYMIRIALMGLMMSVTRTASAQEAPLLELESGGTIASPSEGWWTIGTGWENEWPAKWHHGSVTRRESSGDWQIVHGQIQMPGGTWELRDAFRFLEDGLVELRRRWEWKGAEELREVTLSIRVQVPADEHRHFLPGINYYGNPSGVRVDRSRIPFVSDADPRAFYEEHRFPMPFASVEATKEGALFTAALHSIPSPLRQGARDDQWWSLGSQAFNGGVELALLSGPVASNGQAGIVKANKKEFLPYRGAFLKIQPGDIIEKTCFLQLNKTAMRGTGFQSAVRASIALNRPFSLAGLPLAHEVVRDKVREAQRRYREDELSAGYRFLTKDWDNSEFVMGWAGQTEAPGYAFQVLGEPAGVTADSRKHATRLLDFLAKAPSNDSGFAVRYDFDAHKWLEKRDPLSQAQAMNVFADAIRHARLNDAIETDEWEAFLEKACEHHADRILKEDWRPESTNEAFLVSPLVKAGRLLKSEKLMTAGVKAAEHYLERHASMDEPYWGGTLDARCEDKEGAWAALQAFLEMYEQTQEQRYLVAARHACDVVLSYTFVWNVALPPGRLADHAFQSRGWTSVSVQNHHLDVYGVLIAPAVYRLGHLSGDMDLERIARVMFVSCGQLIDPFGGQGEQIQQTNYSQFGEVTSVDGLRGGYAERWTVFWMTAHFLTAAAQFEEMGVPISRPGGFPAY